MRTLHVPFTSKKEANQVRARVRAGREVHVPVLLALLACGGDPSPPADVPVASFDAMPALGSWAALEGQAHYDAMFTARHGATWFRDEKVEYVFPFLPEHRTDERKVLVWVKTARAPEPGVSFETMTVEGVVLPLTEATMPVPLQTELALRSGYHAAADALLLDAVRIRSVDGVWEAR
jgi:hypothetical protein